MAKYYLYVLFSIFILLNGVSFFEKELKHTLMRNTSLLYKLEKQKLYATQKKEVEEILESQKNIFIKNIKYFFSKDKKETIVFSEIQSYLQSVTKSIDAKVSLLQSATVIDSKLYRTYPISLDLRLIPEDLNIFLKKLYQGKKYLFIESIYVVRIQRERVLRVQITLSGYQLK
jgi:hypothetical protein